MTFTDKNLDSISGIITAQRNRALDRQGYINLGLEILFLLLVGLLLFTQVFMLTQVKGNSMFPALKDGDLVIAFRMQQDYAKRDVIVYTADGETRIGRIVARATDVVTIDESGNLLVNGTNQTGEIMYPTYAKEGYTYPLQVPENHVFVLGDYRTQTEDSRDFGPISMEDVQGKIITIVRRRGL
jgi:signal peptidase I